MFPIRDTIRSRSFPVINWLFIIANVAVFLYESSLTAGQLNRLVYAYGMVPARVLSGDPLAAVTVFTSMFLHGGWLHLFSNMMALFIFGDNVEDRMGPGRYLIFYVLGGALAGIAQAAVNPGSTVPAVGASGAIAAVLGAYLVLFPGSRVVTFVPLFFLPWFIEVPAIIYLGFWFASQFFNGVLALDIGGAMGGIAYWAHVGGFVAGLLLVWFFARRRAYHYRADYS